MAAFPVAWPLTNASTRAVQIRNPSKKALSTVFADKAFRVEDSGIEPLTSCMPFRESRVPSANLSGVAATDSAVCTSVCTSEPKKRRKGGADAASAGAVGTALPMPAVRAIDTVETDFAAALKMLAMLPLSDEERAEAVRRLLKGGGGGR